MNQRVINQFANIIRSNSIAASSSPQCGHCFQKMGKKKANSYQPGESLNCDKVIKWFWTGNQDILQDASQDSPQQFITK